MPFSVTNAPALFEELLNQILFILRRRPLVQELVLSPRKLHPVFHLKGGICVQKKDAQFPRVST